METYSPQLYGIASATGGTSWWNKTLMAGEKPGGKTLHPRDLRRCPARCMQLISWHDHCEACGTPTVSLWDT